MTSDQCDRLNFIVLFSFRERLLSVLYVDVEDVLVKRSRTSF